MTSVGFEESHKQFIWSQDEVKNLNPLDLNPLDLNLIKKELDKLKEIVEEMKNENIRSRNEIQQIINNMKDKILKLSNI